MKKTQKKPVKTKPRGKTLQKQSKRRSFFGRVKYLPALAIAIFATYLSLQPQLFVGQHSGVLAYATDVSVAGLLSATNVQRSNNGVPVLTGNGLLNSAAQAKAQDMVNRNYWSHQTPDGQQPWVFITNAGYQYLAAGENLAYGFMTSGHTVTGWMNSPAHKTNLLSANFTEVGFGIANSPNFVGTGQQTVVVAMYAKPQSYVPPAPAPTPPPAPPAPSPAATKPSTTQNNKPAPVQPAPKAEPEEAQEETPEPESEPEPQDDTELITTVANTDNDKPIAAGTANVQRVQLLANGPALWTISAVTLAVLSIGVLWILHKGVHLKRYIVSGERFILHHLHLDLTVLAVIYLGFVLLSTSGTIR